MAKISINLKDGTAKQEDPLIVGIDLGTTNSLVAYMKDGKPEAIKGKDQKHTLVPSIVHFLPNGAKLVGNDAKEKLRTDPANTIYSVKRLMGKSYNDLSTVSEYLGYQIIDDDTESLVKIRVDDTFYTPVELSANILSALKLRIETELNQAVHKAVITVPAYFNDAQRQATRDAGKLAGLDVLRIVNEPTAASLAYGIGRAEEEAKFIAVYDLGGGTFDISILHIHDGIFEVLSTNGDTFLGGDDVDRLLIDYWLKINGRSKENFILDKKKGQELRLIAEKAKKVLSTELLFKQEYDGMNCQIAREFFDKLIEPLISRTLDKCANALKDAGKTISDIQHVVMVGGSTRIPYIKQTVSNFFQQPLFDDLNPDEVVALGAAIQADILAGNQKGMLLLDITPLSLGIETVGGLMDAIIPRNSKVPSRAARQYTTSVDGQVNLKVAVYQGERDQIADNRKLGEFVLKGIPPMPAGLPKIEIIFAIDADGILRVTAKELRSGVAQEIEIKSQYGISEEEMAKMLVDSITNAEADLKVRSLLEARNEANNVVLATQKFLQQNDHILSEEEKSKTLELAKSLKQSVNGDDKDLINKAMADLNDFTTPIAHRAMDVHVADAMKGTNLKNKKG